MDMVGALRKLSNPGLGHLSAGLRYRLYEVQRTSLGINGPGATTLPGHARIFFALAAQLRV